MRRRGRPDRRARVPAARLPARDARPVACSHERRLSPPHILTSQNYTSTADQKSKMTQPYSSKHAAVQHRRELPEGHLPGRPPAGASASACCRWGSWPQPSASRPGTATTMVKTLAESGLVQYEPYAGVALTPAGEKLAALVVRRHRLIELFLVQVMGYRLGRSARRGRAARARRVGAADRPDGRDARPSRGRPARRSRFPTPRASSSRRRRRAS